MFVDHTQGQKALRDGLRARFREASAAGSGSET
jgi:hypothetical protein